MFPCRRFYTDHVTEIDALHPGAIMRRPRKKNRFPDRKRGRRPRTEERSPCRHRHEDGKEGSLEVDINWPIAEGELMRCLAPFVFIESLTKDKK